MNAIFDPYAMLVTIATLATAQCTWARFVTSLPPGNIDTTPGALPLGIIRLAGHGVTHRESGTTGNPPGRPNKYICYYLEEPWVEGGQTLNLNAIEQRIIATYVAIGKGLVTDFGADDDIAGLIVPSVYLEYDSVKGPYIDYSGRVWVGCRICIYFEERYA